jgi:hypothetical protein
MEGGVLETFTATDAFDLAAIPVAASPYVHCWHKA